MEIELEFGKHSHDEEAIRYWEDMTKEEKEMAIVRNENIYHKSKKK